MRMRIFKEVDEVKNEKEISVYNSNNDDGNRLKDLLLKNNFGKLAEHEEFMRSENESIRLGKLMEHEEFIRSENENIKIGKLRLYR